MSPQPPQCGDCDKSIPFDRYQIGLCAECEKERAMSDPNWHRSTENWHSDPLTHCTCGHQLQDHSAVDLCPCEACDECDAFTEDENWEPDTDYDSGADDRLERDAAEGYRLDHAWMKEQ